MIEITIPRLGWSMDEGRFSSWLKQEGEKVVSGDQLFVLEGEKSVQEIESLDAGILRLLPTSPKAGDVVLVGQLIGYLAKEGEMLPAASEAAVPVVSTPLAEPLVTSGPPAAVRAEPTRAGRLLSSPRARRAAAVLNVAISDVQGTGKSGRVRERDVENFASEGGPRALGDAAANSETGAELSVPITVLRRTIAERMLASLANTAPVTLHCQVDATKLVALRVELKAAAAGASIPSYTDIIVKLSASTLLGFPMLAGQWRENRIVLPTEINIGIAVDTEAGLLVPVAHRVNLLSLAELAATIRKLIDGARGRKLPPEDLRGGVFTITNLGAFGIGAFNPIINFPETAILGLGAIRRLPAVLSDGSIAARDQITLSLTFDHRVVDGAPAAAFLQALSERIGNPVISLLGFDATLPENRGGVG
jgi:pyruvate dehydrogenase E2 component (dihydrolipoamide acetyltransferase)